MPLLSCMVTNCVYNKDELCSKGDIKVGGRDAKVADETCCDSFLDRADSPVTNSMTSGCGCSTIRVDYEACNCKFNEDKKCVAREISIDGACADKCDDTVCESFRCRS